MPKTWHNFEGGTMIPYKVLNKSLEFFPDLKIRFKNESRFMQILGKLMFFNKDFLTKFTTTIGSTIYFPSSIYIDSVPLSIMIVFLHELTHIYDSKRFIAFIYKFLYLFPQILILLCLPLFLLSWKIALPLMLFFALPLPAYFRMYFEKRAYMVSIYALQKIIDKKNVSANIHREANNSLKNFKNANYYWMWVFVNLDIEFKKAVEKVENKEKPFEDEKLFKIIDEIIETIE